jgi:hypothetical protein
MLGIIKLLFELIYFYYIVLFTFCMFCLHVFCNRRGVIVFGKKTLYMVEISLFYGTPGNSVMVVGTIFFSILLADIVARDLIFCRGKNVLCVQNYLTEMYW